MYDYQIYSVNNAISSCVDAETGEIIDFDKLLSLQIEKQELAENIALWVKNEQALVDGLKLEKAILAERQAKAEKRAEQLKQALLKLLDGEKLTTAKCNISYRKSETVDVQDVLALDMWALEQERWNVTTSKIEPNKKEIKKLLKMGVDFGGTATLVKKTNVIIK